MSPEKMIGFSFAAAAAKLYKVFLSAMRRFANQAKRRLFAHTDKNVENRVGFARTVQHALQFFPEDGQLLR